MSYAAATAQTNAPSETSTAKTDTQSSVRHAGTTPLVLSRPSDGL
ncbi:MAG: hypothetical protein QOG70_2698, partial [Solirubrobacteraceae bacterium]|nr:hypothetical protein [Solirubrobacteraceae bacterium]